MMKQHPSLPFLIIVVSLLLFETSSSGTVEEEWARLVIEGTRLFNVGSFEEAENRFRRATELIPQQTIGWTNLGVCQERQRRADRAKVTYLECARVVTGTASVPCLNNACNLALLTSQMINDLVPCEQAIRLDPNSAVALRNWGNVLVQLLQHGEAVPFFERARELDPKDSQAWHNLCLAYSRSGMCAKAISCGEALVAANPEDSGAQSGLAITAGCCNRTDSRGIVPRIRAAELKAKHSTGSGCSSFKVARGWGKAVSSVKVVSAGGDRYGIEPKAFVEKRVAIIELRDVFMEGPSGIIFRGAPDCEVFTGSHLFASKIPEEFDGGGDGTETRTFDEPVASVVQQNPGNYYHAIAETTGALLVLKNHLLGESPMPIIAPRSRSSLVSQAIDMIGINPRDVVDYSGSDGGKVFFRKLFVVDWRHEETIESDLKDSWLPFFPPRFVLSLVANTIGKPALGVDEISDWRVVFIGRSDAGVRRILPNDEPIVSAIRSVVGDRLLTVTGKSMTLAEQVDVFSRAAVIVGPHGAGLTNMLWAPRGACVIIFPMRPESDICFAHMAMALGHRYIEIPSINSYYYGDYHFTMESLSSVSKAVRDAIEFLKLKPSPEKLEL